jgi:hypothetical protein
VRDDPHDDVLHERIALAEPYKKMLAELEERRLKVSIDSIGVDTKLFDRWLPHPTDGSKDFVKLHAAIDDRGAAFSIAITDGPTSDITLFSFLVGDIDAPVGAVRADKAYLSRDKVRFVEDLGTVPYITPKSSSIMKSKAGSSGGTCTSGIGRTRRRSMRSSTSRGGSRSPFPV